MARLSFIVGSILFSWSSAIADAQTIPLDQIWAYEMPGTRDVAELSKTPQDRLVDDILMAQFKRADRMFFKNVARPGFAVAGIGRAALEAAHAVLADNQKPKEVFSANQEITIVFFSDPQSRFGVNIKQVTRSSDKIEIRYSLRGGVQGNFQNLGLIPMGKLPAGKYRVESIQLRREMTELETKFGLKPVDEEWSRQFLCQPFSFEVVEKKKGESP